MSAEVYFKEIQIKFSSFYGYFLKKTIEGALSSAPSSCIKLISQSKSSNGFWTHPYIIGLN
ncbi:hypothetical protein BKI52_22015 [marine bacterium AO1-C]|nr:hypothetical protein BKI52_22015 [marine bacterium AO1-C]